MRIILIFLIAAVMAAVSCAGTPEKQDSPNQEISAIAAPPQSAAALPDEPLTGTPVSAMPDISIDADVPADTADVIAREHEEIYAEMALPELVPEEPVLAEADAEELPPAEVVELTVAEEFAEPEPLVIADAPEPEPEPPSLAVIPEPEHEPLVIAVAPEPEPGPPSLVVAPEAEPEPSPLAATPEPETQPLAIAPKPEPEPFAIIPRQAPPPTPPSRVTPPQAGSLPQAASMPQTAPPPRVMIQSAEEPPVIDQPPQPEPPQEEPQRSPQPRVIPELPNPTPAIRGRQEEMVFSRVVRATVGQLVVIPYRGTGWVYLGEAGSRRGIIYDSRRLDPEGQSFIFRTESAGEYALKFFRQDFIRDFILNDYVQVVVGPSSEAGTGWFSPSVDRGRVVAEPRWPTSLAEAQALSNTRPVPDAVVTAGSGDEGPVQQSQPLASASPVQTPAQPSTQPPVSTVPIQPSAQPPVQPIQPSVTPPQNLRPSTVISELPVPELLPLQELQNPGHESYMLKAKEEFDAGRVDSAISLLDRFFEQYPSGSDEALWLYGQFYEANSPSRNILTSLGYYRRLTQEYPQSSRYEDARSRIAYLQRFYINIH
ncbi:MAG: hypothetical protein FWC24_01310 [Treponema sp.]|nr:hypothetical protein [Treponema sp.]